MASKQAALWMGTARWQALRRALLNEEPLCRMCAWGGRVAAATVADHCVPHRDNEDAFWSGDLQPLCFACHSQDKQRAEERGYYELQDEDGWAYRIGLEGGFPRIGDDLSARAAAFAQATPRVKSLGLSRARPAGPSHANSREIGAGGRK